MIPKKVTGDTTVPFYVTSDTEFPMIQVKVQEVARNIFNKRISETIFS